jgi:hypothetical protein
MSATLAPKARFRIRLRSLRYGLFWLGAALLAWLALAYFALPEIWKRADRQAIVAGLPMVTRTSQGIAGDPINFGLVGDQAEVFCAFRSAGWTLADSITLRSSIRIAGSVVLRRPDPAAPVSPLFYDGRAEDVAFERSEGFSAAHRHHIRLWRIGDDLFDHRPLWLGDASYDRGVGLSHFTLQLTHRIAPDLDAERAFVGAALDGAGAISSFFQIEGIGPTLYGKNGGGDPYFTDGDVLIGVLRRNCDLRPDEAAAPPDNPPHVDLQSALVHAIGGRR